MRKIWKYYLEITDDPQTLDIPFDGDIRFVANQAGLICMWVEVVPVAPKMMRRFVVHGTGHPINASAQSYVGTAQIGPFVWHVFEI